MPVFGGDGVYTGISASSDTQAGLEKRTMSPPDADIIERTAVVENIIMGHLGRRGFTGKASALLRAIAEDIALASVGWE